MFAVIVSRYSPQRGKYVVSEVFRHLSQYPRAVALADAERQDCDRLFPADQIQVDVISEVTGEVMVEL